MNEIELVKALIALGGCSKCGSQVDFVGDTPCCQLCRTAYCIFCSQPERSCDHWIQAEKLKFQLPMPVWPAAHPPSHFTQNTDSSPEYLRNDIPIGLLRIADSLTWLDRVVAKYQKSGGEVVRFCPERWNPTLKDLVIIAKEPSVFKAYVVEESNRHNRELYKLDSLPPTIMSRCKTRLPRPEIRYLSAHWSPDGHLIALAGEKKAVVLDTSSGKRVASLASTGSYAADVKFSDDGTELLVGGGRSIRRWQVGNWKLIDQEKFPTPEDRLPLRPRMEKLPTSLLDKYLPIYQSAVSFGIEATLSANGSKLVYNGRSHRLTAPALGLSLSHDGKFCAVFSKKTLRVFDETGQMTNLSDLTYGDPKRIRFVNNSLKLWIESEFSSCIAEISTNYPDRAYELTFTKDGKIVVDVYGSIYILDGSNFGLVRMIAKEGTSLKGSVSAGKGILLVTGDSSVVVYDWRRDIPLLEVPTHGKATIAELSPCENFLLTGGYFEPAIWEIRTS